MSQSLKQSCILAALECSGNSHYELCADTCSSTCASLTNSQRCPPCQEGCQCDDGFLFDGGECKTLQDCGCQVDGKFYKVRNHSISFLQQSNILQITATYCLLFVLQSGETIIRNECTEKCLCKAGVFSCEPLKCSADQICDKNEGVTGCYKKGKYKLCTSFPK